MTFAKLKRFLAELRAYFLVEPTHTDTPEGIGPRRAAFFEHIDAAQRRAEAARLLREARLSRMSLILFREAALLLARGYLDLRDAGIETNTLSPDQLVTALKDCLTADGRSIPAALAQDLPIVVGASAPGCVPAHSAALEIDRLPAREANLRAEAADALTRWLLTLVEYRSPRQRRAARALRISVALLALIAIPVAAQIWAVLPTNISLHKHVSVSSQTPDSHPNQVVDDVFYGLPSFQSALEDSPWLAVDLGRRYLLSDAEVFGRHDCCFDQSIPLAFEVSDDGETYRTVATKTDPFVSLLPWIAKPLEVEARYVRVRVLRRSILALTEVVVYGRPVKSGAASSR
jgi:hypothetical protein